MFQLEIGLSATEGGEGGKEYLDAIGMLVTQYFMHSMMQKGLMISVTHSN